MMFADQVPKSAFKPLDAFVLHAPARARVSGSNGWLFITKATIPSLEPAQNGVLR